MGLNGKSAASMGRGLGCYTGRKEEGEEDRLANLFAIVRFSHISIQRAQALS